MRGGVFWLGLAVILGGIVHIAAMLVIPALSPKSGYSRFESQIEANSAVVLGPARPDEVPFPFSSPDLVYVVCRFDVAAKPVRFTASLPNTYWSLALYEPDGGNIFHTNSMQSATANPDLVVLNRGQEYEATDVAMVTQATSPRGLVMLRIFLRDPTLADIMEAAAADANCESFDLE